MTAMLSNAQNNALFAEGRVEHINYTAFTISDRTTWIKRMDVVQRGNEAEYIIRIYRGDDIEYLYFSLKNEQVQNNILTADVNNVAYNSWAWAYSDDKAYGTFTSDRNTGIETLDFCLHTWGEEKHFALQWKVLPNSEYDEIHEYMRSRPFITWQEKNPSLKKWKNKGAEELMEKLCDYKGRQIGGWLLEGKNSNGRYVYNLDFSPTGEVSFRYFIEKEYQNGRFLTDIAILRTGAFEIDNNTIEINFTGLLGSRYNRPNHWDDPIEEIMTIKVKVEPKGEKLILTQISGVNVFENHVEHEILKFTASLLPPLEH
jgi:hypothetical protein